MTKEQAAKKYATALNNLSLLKVKFTTEDPKELRDCMVALWDKQRYEMALRHVRRALDCGVFKSDLECVHDGLIACLEDVSKYLDEEYVI